MDEVAVRPVPPGGVRRPSPWPGPGVACPGPVAQLARQTALVGDDLPQVRPRRGHTLIEQLLESVELSGVSCTGRFNHPSRVRAGHVGRAPVHTTTGGERHGYPFDVGGVDDYPVKVGSMLLTLVDPNPGSSGPTTAGTSGTTTTAGAWSARGCSPAAGGWPPRPLKDSDGGRPTAPIARPTDAGSYWPSTGWNGPPPGAFRRVVHPPGPRPLRQRTGLRRAHPRPHLHLPLRGTRLPRRGPVPVDLALDRGYDGLFVLWWDATDGHGTELHHSWSPAPLPDLLQGSAVRSPARGYPRYRTRGPRTPRWTWVHPPEVPTAWSSSCSSTATWIGRGGDPQLHRRRRGRRRRHPAAGRAVPRTVVGTDTYVDQL